MAVFSCPHCIHGGFAQTISRSLRRRQFVHLSSLKDATRMKHGESSSGADWLAGKMVLDMMLVEAFGPGICVMLSMYRPPFCSSGH